MAENRFVLLRHNVRITGNILGENPAVWGEERITMVIFIMMER